MRVGLNRSSSGPSTPRSDYERGIYLASSAQLVWRYAASRRRAGRDMPVSLLLVGRTRLSRIWSSRDNDMKRRLILVTVVVLTVVVVAIWARQQMAVESRDQ